MTHAEAMVLLTVCLNMIAAIRAYIVQVLGTAGQASGIHEEKFVKRMYEISELLLARLAACKAKSAQEGA